MGRIIVQVVVVTLVVLIAAVVLFPLFARPGRGKDSRLIGPDFKPVPGVSIRLPNGTVVVTDPVGKFDLPRKSIRPVHIEGYVLTRRQRHTGGNPDPTYDYSPAIDYVFTVRDLRSKVKRDIGLLEITGPTDLGDSNSRSITMGIKGTVVHRWPAAIRMKDLGIVGLTRPAGNFELTRRDVGSTAYVDITLH